MQGHECSGETTLAMQALPHASGATTTLPAPKPENTTQQQKGLATDMSFGVQSLVNIAKKATTAGTVSRAATRQHHPQPTAGPVEQVRIKALQLEPHCVSSSWCPTLLKPELAACRPWPGSRSLWRLACCPTCLAWCLQCRPQGLHHKMAGPLTHKLCFLLSMPAETMIVALRHHLCVQGLRPHQRQPQVASCRKEQRYCRSMPLLALGS